MLVTAYLKVKMKYIPAQAVIGKILNITEQHRNVLLLFYFIRNCSFLIK